MLATQTKTWVAGAATKAQQPCVRRGSALATPSSPLWYNPLCVACRLQASDQFHRYLHNPHIVQPDGIDSLPRTKGDQQQWLNVEQWDGYSDTYLRQHMQYPPTNEHPNNHLNFSHNLLSECLRSCYEYYGKPADQLQRLHEDPLHPHFHQMIAGIKKDREKIAEELDRVYANLHPTVKTVYDAYLVRRYYQLGDWIERVEQKRHDLLCQLSPEYIRQAERARGVAAHFLSRLKQLQSAFTHNPTLGLLDDAMEGQYTHDELVMLRQKAAYFRNMRQLGANQQDADVHTH
ncbi:hypothetical protein, conserved [Trypanosoma brucei gambiense DAL972]|uniref:Uncharacterized protein n=2 Tax=Trypanosoma brucei TaxID=5691 RepID=C9ZY18_TRYB9|nr:hypothetical protein, conserved [Trypanosoma brucei gambiense DAL972]RHW70691.1 hypothetical protein DPX39_090037200 [Trypanosoma brucei equiperdum]CBH14313.1 hypothetical protein, conserved [Trypanosoma brucei gambiense DAL972]|eukprot:XP_011776583.1 hypothetical protein, conserved [Trypanosoma brucei gambiense DAL972]